MQKLHSAVIGILLVTFAPLRGWTIDPVWEYSVQVSAVVQTSPAKITLAWPQDTTQTPSSYTIYRKAPGAPSWGAGTTLPGSATSYQDGNVTIGTTYEYQIIKDGSPYTGYGYICAGVNAPLVEERGKVVLIVENTHAAELAPELARLQQDLAGDGWTVLRHDVSRNDSVVTVKNFIKADYHADPANVKGVFLFGRVPVPYSGLQNPDGHSDHYGAWPADVFYGDMDGNWTDNSVSYQQNENTDAIDRARLSNVPGDGKFDQTYTPSTVELQVGRVDLANMPGRTTWGGPATFKSEKDLLRQYLNKDHNFRHKLINPQRRAVLGDYFGSRNGEAFAASGFRNFAPFFGAANIVNLNVTQNDTKGVWIPHLAANDYLWAYGCGAGGYVSIGGLGNSGNYNDGTTVEMVNNDIRATFTLLFGSWLGDWDHEDNIMRSVLATPTYGLACGWSGRPHWYTHHMALGETIGSTARLTQNNGSGGLYKNQYNSAAGGIHIALMGDPTLRMHPVAPPASLTASTNAAGVALAWAASPDPVLGYHVYRSASLLGPFTRMNDALLTGNSFADTSAQTGAQTYMVRAVKLETSASGTYTNASQGIFWSGGLNIVQGTNTAGTNIVGVTNSAGTNTVTTGGTTTNSSVVWFDDALPAAAGPGSGGGDSWNWINSSPAPFHGTYAHQSSLSAGLHEHYFNWASATLTLNAGESIFTYVYLDPANPPSELMLSWNADTWEHRAYWGANRINYGADASNSRRYIGPLPAAGQWVRLEVPASQVGLEGKTLSGMGFSLFDGRATWDYTGKSTPSAPTSTSTVSTVTIVATDANASETGQDGGGFTITRTGSTAAPLTVNLTTSGTATKLTDYRRSEGDMPELITIPAGTASVTLTVYATDDSELEGDETIIVGVAASAGYTVGSPASGTITIIANDGTPPLGTNTPVTGVAQYSTLELPKPGENELHILSPTLIELRSITAKQPDPAPVEGWNPVNANGQFVAPALSEFAVTVNGQAATVQSVGFKRRPLYAPLAVRDLRVDNCLYLQLAAPIADNQTVEVKNPSGALWPAARHFKATADPRRFSPAIHVNQEGYVPSLPKKAMVGYYLGNLGEMEVPASLGFKLIETTTGAPVHQGSLVARPDVGWAYTPTPYQKVLEADFTSFTQPGEYQLVVPGLGASFPFLIDDGVAMAFTRTYALGLYHQRCGADNKLPYTRHTHGVCHAAPADVPSPQSAFVQTWNVLALVSSDYANNPRHTAPQLKDEVSQLYPFVNKGKIDVSRGHHDAGDYSKYTINSANLIHYLMFTVDTVPGASSLDNLGLPESGDGIGDLLQTAKWEADYIAKLQDADGGFYFIVYPRDRRYESNVLPDNGDPQVVWPKTTAVTAAAVAALAQCASSPLFKQNYPAEAALYLQKAQLGWNFLTTAIARFGKDGSYQKLTPYGDDFMHDDELAWAACEMFLATGNAAYHQKLMEWFPNPSDPATYRWGWWRLPQSYGNTIRSYAFAARTSRVTGAQLNAAYLAKCETEMKSAANDAVIWSKQSAYGTSFPFETKQVKRAGWYFSSDHASDIAAAYQLEPRPEYLQALVANMNYEAGCNPVNVTYVTGLGWKRQREIVHHVSQNDRRVLPPSGIPLGNVQEGFYYMQSYQGELNALCFPGDWSTTPLYPFYDRWGDAYNVMTEFVHLNQARSLLMFTLLSSFTSAKSRAWTSGTAQIVIPSGLAGVDEPIPLTLTALGLDLNGARILWEGRDQEPRQGPNFDFVPKLNGVQWVEAEVQWPDGRRVFATNSFFANSPTVIWVDDALPTGASPSVDGGDTWNWVSTPTPTRGTKAHQSAISAGLHEHYFNYATATLEVSAGDTLFVDVYLDPANVPSEVMLMWNDGTWEHRAYWGANQISFGNDGTASRRRMGALPEVGKWVRLEVPASAVGLERRTLRGMGFTLYGGRATWDCAGKSNASEANNSPALPTVSVMATDATASRGNSDTGTFTITRTGNTVTALTVNYTLGGTAVNGSDYSILATSLTIPAGAASATRIVTPSTGPNAASASAILTLSTSAAYAVGTANSATVTISGGSGPKASISMVAGNMHVAWPSIAGKTYHVLYKNNLNDPNWTYLATDLTATGTTTSFTDITSGSAKQRFYAVYSVD